MNNQPIFLLGAHKSGTSLLRSILDGHSQLYTIPIEAHFFQNAKFWVDYDYRSERPQKISISQLIERFCQWIHLTNISADQYSDSVANNIFDEARFRQAISDITEKDDEKSRMEKYFQAIHFSVTGKNLPEKIRVVEKSIETAEMAIELQYLFPGAKFIHIVRNPYSNIVSFRKFKSFKYGYPLLPRITRSFYNSFYYLYKNQRVINNYMVIRYEDLVAEPNLWIKKMCNFLNIAFEDILLTPTYLGKKWGGNSTTGKSFEGISADQLDRWQKEIYPIEVFLINRLFRFVLEDFKYPFFPQRGSFWKRAKGENLNRYFFNRFYKFYLPK